MTRPDYERFAYEGNASFEEIHQIEWTRRVRYVPTGDEVAGGNDQKLAVSEIAPPAPDDGYVIRITPFSDDTGRLEWTRFNAYLAHESNKRVLSVNAPGVDFSEWRDKTIKDEHELSPRQREALKGSSFAPVGRSMMRALVDYVKDASGDADQRYTIASSSMAAAIVPGMIQYGLERGVTFDGVIIEEPVNVADRSFVSLVAQFGLQNRHVAGYIDGNPDELTAIGESMSDWLKRTVEARSANFRYARSLARAGMVRDLGDLSGLSRTDQDTGFVMTRGAGSKLSPERGFRELGHLISGSGIDLTERTYGDPVSDPHDHPYTMTVQSVIEALRMVGNRER